jgi:hypothetical protein
MDNRPPSKKLWRVSQAVIAIDRKKASAAMPVMASARQFVAASAARSNTNGLPEVVGLLLM